MSTDQDTGTITICGRCENFAWAPHLGQKEPSCRAVRKNYISDGAYSFARCEDVNTNGSCELFAAKSIPSVKKGWLRTRISAVLRFILSEQL
jgi:hypothetical protein